MKFSWSVANIRDGRVSRRQVLAGGVAALSAGLGVRARPSRVPLSSTMIAPGVHVRRGIDADASAANEDAIANATFIMGRDAVAVIDPGGSLRDGERLRAHIARVTHLPVRYVIISHVHPDHLFGAGAFLADEPLFIGHARLPDAIAQRGDYYQQTLERLLGLGRAGPLIVPTRVVTNREHIDLGGRVLELQAHGVAHSDCDLSVFDPASGTLVMGDLLFVGRIPALDGNIKGWLQTLAQLKSVPAQRAVPGHGPASVSWPAGAAALERYLGVLLQETRLAVKRGLDLGAAVAVVGRSERGKWRLFDDYHGHNVTQAFKEVEWE